MENFCRTPDPGDTVPWCFVKNFYPKKEACDIPQCPYKADIFSYFKRLWASFLDNRGLNRNLRFWK